MFVVSCFALRADVALADIDQAVVDASGPDVSVVVGVYAFDGVCRERKAVARHMREGPDSVGFEVNDVDSAAVCACEYGGIVLCKAEDDVLAEG